MFALCRPKYQLEVYSKGNTRKFGPKSPTPCWFERQRHSIANCGRMVTDSATVTMESLYRKPPSLFLMMPSLTPYDLPFPQNVGYICRQDTQMAISPQRVIRYTSCSVLGLVFQGRRIEWRYFRLHQIQVGGRPPSWIISNGHIFATAHLIHLCSAHRGVIFAIAELSCSIVWMDMEAYLRLIRYVVMNNLDKTGF